MCRKTSLLTILIIEGFAVISGFFNAQIYNSKTVVRVSNRVPITTDGQRYIDDASSLQSQWWDLFKPATKSVNNGEMSVSTASFVGAWRALSDEVEEREEDDEDDDGRSPPCSLAQYLNGGYVCSPSHQSNIDQLWSMARGTMDYLPEVDRTKVLTALKVAYVALWGKNTARSLEVSINRARGTAVVLGEMKADLNVVLSGILNEVVSENQNNARITGQLTELFGEDVMELSLSYSRLPKFMARKTDYTEIQSENQLQMLVALVEDYRALYIRVADRVHAMRVLEKLPLDEVDKVKISQEAICLYALLAHKMGLTHLRGELEDSSFKFLDPETFKHTEGAQIAANKAYYEASDHIMEMMGTDPVLTAQNASFHLTHRVKGKYQLYLKMLRKDLSSASEVRDALGLRLILDVPQAEEESYEGYQTRLSGLCYYVVERLRHMPGWEPTKKGFKDYIKGKKENGYQSLHQYIRNVALKVNVEVQVRTNEMHYNAELGGAAHWSYKDEMYRPTVAKSKVYRHAWRSPEQLKALSAACLIGLAKKQLTKTRVYVYLEDKSTVLNLSKNDTALDAAFSIHTAVGLSTQAIYIDGQPVPMDYQLTTGDVISVKCADSIQATPDWFGLVKSTYALSSLRKYYREHDKEWLVCRGLVQMLSAFELNAHRFKRSLQHGVPDAARLVKMVRDRSGLNLVDFLVALASSPNKADQSKLMGTLMQVDASELTLLTPSAALMWASMQGREEGGGWENQHVQEHVLIPFLRDILPAAGVSDVEACWMEIVGAASLEPTAAVAKPTVTVQPVASIELPPTPEGVKVMIPHGQYPSLVYTTSGRRKGGGGSSSSSSDCEEEASAPHTRISHSESLTASIKEDVDADVDASDLVDNSDMHYDDESHARIYKWYRLARHSPAQNRIASRPYALQAPALPREVQRQAKQSYAQNLRWMRRTSKSMDMNVTA